MEQNIKIIKYRGNIINTLIIVFLFIMTSCKREECTRYYEPDTGRVKQPAIEFNPKKYICYKAGDIIIDGIPDEESWQQAEWTDNFTDIEGDPELTPIHRTRVKMLWDSDYLYIAAELSEPDIWARLMQRDTVIFYDNDFEVFIDPDGDTHNYMEFEMNAYNTMWDLFLTRPYRDKGKVIDAWDINGIKSAVKIYGTINDPSDTDDKWVIELAFPFTVLTEAGNPPADNIRWRINFSRVNWILESENGSYIKAKDPETAKNYSEFNWVWSPQGLINMHYPEMWGYLQFSDIKAGEGTSEFISDPDEKIKWNLRTLYYAQRNYAAARSRYAAEPDSLYNFGYEKKNDLPAICILLKAFGYEAYMLSKDTKLLWKIDETGKVSAEKTE